MGRLNEALDYNSKYEKNGILLNKLNIENGDSLNKIERKMTGLRLAQLYLNPGKQTFDVKHYICIHKFLFGDIYEFAGEIRNENIQKVIPFCIPNYIYPNLKYVLQEAKIKSKNISSREELVDFITCLYPELDIIHPFREGNGRCEREFLRQYTQHICNQNGLEQYILNFENIEDKDSFIKAIIIADARDDKKYLRAFIDKMVVKDLNKEKSYNCLYKRIKG